MADVTEMLISGGVQQQWVGLLQNYRHAFLSNILVACHFARKGERVWVVFCVHDDTEAFLELYSDQKVAVTHKPDWCVSLNNCLHVSPTICPQEDEYEFVVTLRSLANTAVRLPLLAAEGTWHSWLELLGISVAGVLAEQLAVEVNVRKHHSKVFASTELGQYVGPSASVAM
ncbi:hypothetical protein PR048_025317 [Dryococelus australis]|uniref:Uncharacterized protein n=1 Tax=Dryococelus australis TaxID=614101 RepID=A0ABQ9GR34_9NEOP|nr:hypothetical protein PR048_025317 [Dryococelus australis]